MHANVLEVGGDRSPIVQPGSAIAAEVHVGKKRPVIVRDPYVGNLLGDGGKIYTRYAAAHFHNEVRKPAGNHGIVGEGELQMRHESGGRVSRPAYHILADAQTGAHPLGESGL